MDHRYHNQGQGWNYGWNYNRNYNQNYNQNNRNYDRINANTNKPIYQCPQLINKLFIAY